jgi:hypothetical protein
MPDRDSWTPSDRQLSSTNEARAHADLVKPSRGAGIRTRDLSVPNAAR